MPAKSNMASAIPVTVIFFIDSLSWLFNHDGESTHTFPGSQKMRAPPMRQESSEATLDETSLANLALGAGEADDS